MSVYAHQVRNLKLTNRVLIVGLLLMALTIIGMTVGLVTLSRSITVYIPPDTSNGATVQAGVPGAANVYGFANYIIQYVNHWPGDGEKDYPKRIFEISNYITPRFKAVLENDVRHSLDNSGINELKSRVRQLELDPDHLFETADVTMITNGV